MWYQEDGPSNQKTPYNNVTKKYTYIPNNHGHSKYKYNYVSKMTHYVMSENI